jgi:hypothetical protein
MAHTHEYDCIVCGAHFDSSRDLSKHNESEHLRNATGMERPRQDADAGAAHLADRAARDGAVSGDGIDPAYAKDRMPRQGFQDPRADSSDRT